VLPLLDRAPLSIGIVNRTASKAEALVGQFMQAAHDAGATARERAARVVRGLHELADERFGLARGAVHDSDRQRCTIEQRQH
ncbi:hypothetical protein QM312_37030, partial [Burkholderia cenocepacia]|nr:hypothetical protein [Burkholderia cenocepacia]